MRRRGQALSQDACVEILNRGTSGVLALAGDGGYPYAVPLSYIYDGGKLYFHCAPGGHKLDALQNSDKASFCVIGRDEILPEKFTTCFRSVIAFGRVRILTEDGERRTALEKLAEKYSPGIPSEREIGGAWNRVCLLELSVEHLSGKEAIELVGKRKDKECAEA